MTTEPTDEQLIKWCAEMDGKYFGKSDNDPEECWRYKSNQGVVMGLLPRYTESYDAIIPLVQKQPSHIRISMFHEEDAHWTMSQGLMMSPKQLAIALCKATGRIE